MKKRWIVLLSIILVVLVYFQTDAYATAKRNAVKTLKHQIAGLRKNGGGIDARLMEGWCCIISNADDMQFVLDYIKSSSADRFARLPFVYCKACTPWEVKAGEIELRVCPGHFHFSGVFSRSYSVSAEISDKMMEFLRTFERIDVLE